MIIWPTFEEYLQLAKGKAMLCPGQDDDLAVEEGKPDETWGWPIDRTGRRDHSDGQAIGVVGVLSSDLSFFLRTDFAIIGIADVYKENAAFSSN